MASGKSLIKSEPSAARKFIVTRVVEPVKGKLMATSRVHDRNYVMQKDGSIRRAPKG